MHMHVHVLRLVCASFPVPDSFVLACSYYMYVHYIPTYLPDDVS